MAARALTLLLAVMAVAGVVGAQDAFGCSCVGIPADELVAGAEAAFEGTVISSQEVPDGEPDDAGPQPPGGDVDLRFKVERVFKGSLDEEVTVRTSGDDGTCGLGPREPGARLALTLSRDDEGRWLGSSCGQFDPDELEDPGSPPPPSLEPATLAQLARPSPVAAWRETAVWSAYDEGIGAYRLMVADGDDVGPLPVEPSPIPFDADVGPDSSGEPAAVYSRCGQTPAPPQDRSAADCDLFIYGLRDDRGERPIRNANSESSEFGPSLWRGEVAWVRSYEGRDEPVVYTRPLIAPRERRSERAPGLPQDVEGAARFEEVVRVEEVELYGRNLAIDAVLEVVDVAGRTVNELRLADLRDGTSRRIARAPGGSPGRDYVGVSLDAGRVAWYLTIAGDPITAGGPFRHRISTGDVERMADTTELAGFAWTLGGSYRVTAQQPSVARTGPLDWRSADADDLR